MIRQRTFTVTYNYFEPGTIVEPTSTRSSLEPGQYKVLSCHEPRFDGDDAVVFVEGRGVAVRTEYLREVTNG